MIPTQGLPEQVPTTAALRFDVLGPLRASRDGLPLQLGPYKQQAVLATLLLSANTAVSPGHILDAVWPGDAQPDNGFNVVQKYVAALRRVLDPDRAPRSAGQVLSLTATGYQLAVQPNGSDLDEFANRVSRARELRVTARPEEAATELQSALALWRGEPLAGLAGPVFAAARERVNDDRASALEDYAEILLDLGRLNALVDDLPGQIREFPLRERLRAVQMEALHRSGRRAEALAAYDETRRLLVDQYGIEPGQALQRLYNDLLNDSEPPAAHTQPAHYAPAPPYPPHHAYWPEQPTVARRTRKQRIGLKVLAAALPILTWGFASGPMMVVLAWRRRSRLLGLAAVAYFALQWTGAVLFAQSAEDFSGSYDDIGMSLMIFPFLACSVHAALIVAPASTADNALTKQHRRLAREIAARSPQFARQLGIGRPDLPRVFDDGGLVDPNHVTAELLAMVPGITVQHAALIVVDRSQRGPFRSVEELAERGLLPRPLPRSIADRLVIVDPPTVDHQTAHHRNGPGHDSVGGARHNP